MYDINICDIYMIYVIARTFMQVYKNFQGKLLIFRCSQGNKQSFASCFVLVSLFKMVFLFQRGTTFGKISNFFGEKWLSYLGPKIWNSLSSDLKSTESINQFKHKIKGNFFQNIQREEKDIYMFY